MSRTLHVKTTVLPGNRIEIRLPELPEGCPATVLIVLDEEEAPKRRLSEVLGGYSGGKAFQTAEEVEVYLRAERDSWDR